MLSLLFYFQSEERFKKWTFSSTDGETCSILNIQMAAIGWETKKDFKIQIEPEI